MWTDNCIAVSYGPFETINKHTKKFKQLYLFCGKMYKKESI